MNTTCALRTWSQVLRLHPDVETGNTAVTAYAIDLRVLAEDAPRIPHVYCQPADFFTANRWRQAAGSTPEL
jgi:hypothetical protein